MRLGPGLRLSRRGCQGKGDGRVVEPLEVGRALRGHGGGLVLPYDQRAGNSSWARIVLMLMSKTRT